MFIYFVYYYDYFIIKQKNMSQKSNGENLQNSTFCTRKKEEGKSKQKMSL